MYIYLYINIVSIIIYKKVPPSNLDDFLYCQDHHSESCSHDFNDRCSLKCYEQKISSKQLRLYRVKLVLSKSLNEFLFNFHLKSNNQ